VDTANSPEVREDLERIRLAKIASRVNEMSDQAANDESLQPDAAERLDPPRPATMRQIAAETPPAICYPGAYPHLFSPFLSSDGVD
jgi:hypothetical protein